MPWHKTMGYKKEDNKYKSARKTKPRKGVKVKQRQGSTKPKRERRKEEEGKKEE